MAEMPAPPDPAPLPMEHAKPQPTFKAVRMKPLIEEVTVGGDDEAADFAPTTTATPAMRERTTRRRSTGSKTSVSAGAVFHEVVQETEAVGALFSKSLLHHVGIFWREFAHPLWLPLLGLATLGTAFTVPVWLAVPDILAGTVLVHIRAWQDWVRITCHWSGKTCRALNVERAFAVVAVLLGMIALLYRVVVSGAGHLAAFDIVSLAFSVGGAASAWCKPTTAPIPRLREVPSSPLLLLFLAISTLAPAPGLASLPYALLFLALLVRLVRMSGLHPLSFGVRLGLLLLTTCHIVALLGLSFLGEEGAHPSLVDIFGNVGRAVASNEGARNICFWNSGSSHVATPQPAGPNGTAQLVNATVPAAGPSCRPGTEVFWPGLHVTALLLLHFVLTNGTILFAGRKASERPETPPELTTLDGLGAKAWTKSAVRWGIFANLVALVLWFPSLMSLPLLVMAFSLTAEKSSLMRCFCGLLRRCCKRGAELSPARGLHWRGRYVCVYIGLVFITEYIFNISQSELPGKPRLAAWLNDRLHLQDRVHWPQPVVTNRRTWLQCIGLEAYGTLGAGRAASVFFPQAVILTIVAAMQSMLDDPEAPRPEVLQMIGKAFERVWFVGASMVGPEVSMVAVLIQIMMILNCQDGSSSVMTIAYMSVLVVLMTSKKLIRAQLWLLLQCLAEMTSFFLVLVYIFNAPSMVLAQPFDKFITVRCTNLGALVAPHLGIALVAGLQRLVIFANDTRTSGRARTSTVDSVFSSSEASTSPTNRVRHRVWMHIMEYLDRKAIRRMKLLFEELLVLAVMILSLAAALLPPVDVHSLALLAVVGPALLIYNFEDDREKFLLRVLQLLQMLSAFFLFSRVVVASPLFPLPPADHRFFSYITMQELGINQPIGDHRKPLCLGFVTILTRVAIREARMAIYEIGELESEQILERERLSYRSQMSQMSTTSVGADGSPEEVPATQPASLLQSMDSIGACADGPEEVKATHRPGFFGGSSVGGKRSTASGDLANQALTRRKIRRETRLNMGPRWEERMIMKWAPNWLPLKAHAYISAVLLVMSFGVSITEVHLLNFLMIAAVVGLCGWSELWVQAGNVFSVTTVKIMLVQYIFRFQVWQGLIPTFWFQVLGFMWTDAQVVRHCSILSLCLLQKQLWHRGRYSKPRAPNCPSWLSRHAELIGMAALLLVAVARRHSVSPMLALAALPWLVGEEAGLTARLSFLTKGWLRFFRLILMLTLMSQVIMKLLVEFKMEERVDPFFNWHCALWEADVTVAPGNNATLTAPAAARLECIQEWRSYSSMLGTSGAHMLWEFLALFLLGMVQQLYERRTSEYGQPVSSHWKLLVMHWWIVLVYGLTLLLSLEGGTIVGMTFLGLLLAVAFNSGGVLAKRRRWVWRCQLVAWFFLFAGLVVQSPLLPCGRAACHGEVHRTFMPRDQCAVLQELNVTIGESSEQTKSCGSHAAGKALGHDTLSTLAMQVMGFRRVRSSSFWDDLGALLGSQLGTLLQLILACAVQIRISNSRLYREKLEQGFVAEGEQLAVERARRFVHEFYCRCRIEETASRERRRALRDKLKRVMRKINEILAGRAVSSVNAKDMDDVKHQILEEELQLSHGVKKEVAREVTAMFDYDMSLSKQYLDMMHLVMLGRVQPDSHTLQRDFERMQQNATKSRLSNSAVRAAQQLSSQSHEGLKSQGTEVTETNSTSSLQSRQRARLRGIQAWCRAYWQSILEVWEAVKRSKHVSKVMCDYAFLCIDEVAFTLRKPSAAAAEELHTHRKHNGPLRLLWKIALSNMAPLVAVAAVLAFIETRSMIDVARAFVVFFVALHSYPFPPKQLWKGLLAFNVGVLALRTFYDLPVLCAGPSLRAREPSGLAWEPDSTLAWCPPNTHLTWDVTFGVAKRRGASALDQSSWFWAVWADHLCIWTVLLHQWMLAKSGLWDHVYFDQETKQCFLHDTGEADASCALVDGATPPSPDLPSALRAPKLLQLPGEEVMELDMDAKHRGQVIAAVRVKDRLISEYYDMLAMQEKKRRARREHHNLVESSSLEQTGSPDRRDTRSESASSTGTPSKSPSSWLPSNSKSSAQLSAQGGSSHQLLRGAFGGRKVFTRGSMLRLSWITGEHADRTSRVPEECELYLFCLDGDEEQVDYKIHELIKIQRAVKRFLERQRKARRIRCLMGHPLKKEVTLGVVATSSRNRGGGPDRDYQVCERCSKMISTSVRYSCKECDYHACADCVQTLLALDQGMGKQDGVRERNDCRPGIAVYWLKYLLGLVLLCYFLIANTAIFSSESRSTLEAVQANNISTHTLSLLTVHLLLLITDRVFHKWHYRNSDSDASLKSIETLNLLFLLAEFIWVHTIIIMELWNISNIREIQISLFSEWALCLYYLGWMTYLGVCIAQRKYGLPAVDHDTLRPTAPPESFGITMEKFYTFSWYAHYALPFVDDLRVIIDWSVMPTSLDLWMHFKVEDAHSWLFRTRHAMYIRRQSFFAERRDSCEKVYSGWLLVLLLIFIMLMPLLIFSPITPFTSAVGIELGNVEVELGVATACINGQDRIECRFNKVQLFKAVANQIITYNDSRKTDYLSAHPSAPSTDIDIDEVEWPAHSLEPLQISHPVGREIQGLLDAEVPRLVYFRINLALLRTGTTQPFSTTHTVCFCAPEGSCTPDGWHWPPSAKKYAECSIMPSNHNITRMQNFWRQLGKGESPVVWSGLQRMWDGKVRVGTTGADKQGPEHSVDLSLNNCSSNCNASWCSEAHCWGKLDVPGHFPATVIYELERSATLNALSTSSTSFSVIGLYLAVVLVAGRYLRAAFQDSSKRAIYEEIPDVGAFLDLVTAIKLAREHRDLRTEFQLYYCLMKVLRSTNLLLTAGGHEPRRYGAGRTDEQPPECEEPRETRLTLLDDARDRARSGWDRDEWSCPRCEPKSFAL